MPDLIRISTPLINRGPSVTQKNGPEPVDTFSLQNTSKVLNRADQLNEQAKQTVSTGELNYTPALLLSLLNDPDVMTSYLQNMNLILELLKLLPAENEDGTRDAKDIQNSIMLEPDRLTSEMKSQVYASTAFNGEIFDFLRKVSDSNWDKPEVQTAIAKFLQSAYNMGNREEIADSCVNNLSFLKNEISAGSALSDKLEALISGFSSKDIYTEFPELKTQTLDFVKQLMNGSPLSSKAEEIASLIKYNLSRSDGSAEIVTENALNLIQHLSPNEKRQFLSLFDSYLNNTLEGGKFSQMPAGTENSKVISLISEVLSRQTQSDKLSASGSDRLNSELRSLLMSPCNFTALSHLVLPLQYDQMKALAEVWINRERNERENTKNDDGNIHILMIVDIENAGRFEAEFDVRNFNIDFYLYCPEGTETDFGELINNMPKILGGTNYHIGKTELATRSRTRSLIDVFKSLPNRRVGVNVKA